MNLLEKTNLINEVAEMVISEELGYMPTIKDIYFDYCLLKFVGEVPGIEEENFSLVELEKFVNDNEQKIKEIKASMDKELSILKKQCDDLIRFKKNHYSAFDNVLNAIANFINESAGKQFDPAVVKELAEIVKGINEKN